MVVTKPHYSQLWTAGATMFVDCLAKFKTLSRDPGLSGNTICDHYSNIAILPVKQELAAIATELSENTDA